MTEIPIRSDLDLLVFATEVFGRDEPARKWLETPHPMLDGLPPKTFASNEVRARKVRGMLASLKYGGVA